MDTTNFRKREKQKNVVRFARILLKYKRFFRSNLVICENQFENPQKQIFSVLVFKDHTTFFKDRTTFFKDRSTLFKDRLRMFYSICSLEKHQMGKTQY